MAKERGGSPASVEGMQDSGSKKRKRAAMKGSTSKVIEIAYSLRLLVLQSSRWSVSNVQSIRLSFEGNNG
jgi:hypothetical protein